MSNASSVDNSGGDGSKGEEGDGHVDGHQQADHQDGEQGEADADEHVVDDEAHHLVEESAMGRSKVQWIEPDKDLALKLLIMIISVKGNQPARQKPGPQTPDNNNKCGRQPAG